MIFNRIKNEKCVTLGLYPRVRLLYKLVCHLVYCTPCFGKRYSELFCKGFLAISNCLVLLVLALSPQNARADLALNGIAMYEHLKEDQYYMSIYAERPSDQPDKLLDNTMRRRMEIHVTMPKLFVHGFVQNLVYSVSTNNSKEQVYKNAFQVIAFTDSLKGNLVKGDVLIIEYFPGKGTSLTLNAVELQTFPGEDFFNMLLRTWIGPVPPSSGAKADLLMGEKEKPRDLIVAFSNVKPSLQRIDEIKAWKVGGGAKANAVVDAAAAVKSSDASSLLKSSKAVSSVKPVVEKSAEPVQKPEAKLVAQIPVKEVPKAEVETQAPQPVSEPDVKESEEVHETLTVASFLAKRDYLAALTEWVQKNVAYPVILTDETATDSINFDIVIDRNGAVKEVIPTNETKSSVLNKGALKAINQSTPFPKMPPGITGDTFSFSLHFSLHRRYTH